MLDVRGLDVAPDGAPLLQGIGLTLATGEVLALLGHPGSGKTLLARALCGLVPARGRLTFMDRDMTGADHTAMVRAGLIHVPQDAMVFPNLAARDNLLLGATMRGRHRRQARLAEVLEMLPALSPCLERRAGTLDRGLQQLLAIGRGLMAGPLLLVLDDAGAALDDTQRSDLALLVDRLSLQGLPILLTGRSMAPPLTAATRVCVLDGGRIHPRGATPW